MTFTESTLGGLLDSIELDYAKLIGNEKFSLANPDEPGISAQERSKRQRAFERTKPQIESQIKRLNLDGSVDIKFNGEGKLSLSTNGKKLSYKETLRVLRAAGKASGASRLGSLGVEIKARYTAKMLGSYSWLHPVEKLKGMALDKIEEKLIAKYEKRAKKAGTDIVKSSPEYETDANGNPVDGDPNTDGIQPKEKINPDTGHTTTEDLGRIEADAKVRAAEGKAKFGKGFKIAGITGGIASILMIGICSIVNASEAHLENMFGLEQTGSSMYQETRSNWGQIQAAAIGLDNDGIDMNVLGALREQNLYSAHVPDTYEVDEDGQITEVHTWKDSSWADASSYQTTVNGAAPRTEDMPDQVENMYKEGGGWAAELASMIAGVPGLNTLFNGAGFILCNEITGWIMTALGSADPVGLIITAITLIPAVSEKIGEFLAWAFQIGSGIAYDQLSYDHGQNTNTIFSFGNHNSITAFSSEGAGIVSASQAYENQLLAQEWLDADWKERPLAQRIFDASDYRSTVARVVNGARIDTMPSDARGYFANFAKLIGAVPNFIAGGLFGNRSAEAMAASAVSYPTGAPKIELSQDWMDTITSNTSYDWDVNFYGCGIEEMDDDGTCQNGKTGVKGLLDGSKGADYRKYAKECLGQEIGTESDGYIVKSFEPSSAKEARLVGMKGGTWETAKCEERVESGDNDGTADEYKSIGLYVMDYPILAGYAWYSTDSDDPEAQKIAKELGFDDGNSSSGPSNSSVDAESLMTAFESETTDGDFDGAFGRQCVDLSLWFVSTRTTLTPASANGGDVVSAIVAANPGKVTLSKEPKAPGVFSTRSSKYRANESTWCSDINAVCGHTGLVVAVDGNTVTLLDTWNGLHKVEKSTVEWAQGDSVDFVYLGDVLKK